MMRAWRNLAFEDWPKTDQVAWKSVLHDGNALDGRGAGANWSEATRLTNRKHYAGWLGWLKASDHSLYDVIPGDRITPEQVHAYARALMSGVAPKTVASYLRDLKVVALAMSPERDWRWLSDLSNRLKVWAKPVRAVRGRGLSAAAIFDRSLEELDRLRDGGITQGKGKIAYRDTLMSAILIAAPIRLKNIAMIDIGTHLTEYGQHWQLRFAAHEVKNRMPLRFELPQLLSGHIRFYLGDLRPCFAGAEDSVALWFGQKRSRMAEITVYNAIMRITKALFGEAINPHAFRTIAATFLADSSPQDALHARPLLGHRQFETTETYYIRALQIEASRKLADAIREVRNGTCLPQC